MKENIKKILYVTLFLVFLITHLISTNSSRITNFFRTYNFNKYIAIQDRENEFNSDFENFQLFVEEALTWRASALKQIAKLKYKIETSDPLSSSDISYLHDGGQLYLSLRESLLKLAHKHRGFIDKEYDFKWSPGAKTVLQKNNIIIDPLDKKGDLLVKQFKLSLSSALVLYDNFLLAIWPYHQNTKLRELINHDNQNVINGLNEVTKNYLSEENRKIIVKAIEYFQIENKWRQSQKLHDIDHQYLDQLILGSPTFTLAQEDNWLSTTNIRMSYALQNILDGFGVFKQETMNVVSALFGNAVGLIETRKGKLLSLSKNIVNQMKSQLRPLDILLEKTPFRLTDKLIPGHFGHVAIWLGSKQELKNSGMWDHPLVLPHHQSIEQGKNIVEALRDGVQLSSFEHFLNIDDLTVIRYKPLHEKKKKFYLENAFKQIGKSYDFNFDVESDKKIVCSELAYVVFSDFKWPVEKKVGRYTISPDNVVNLAIKEKHSFEIPIMYHDGKMINKNLWESLHYMLEGSYSNLSKIMNSNENRSIATEN
ncbi:MAG: hypothetical protein KDD58_02485 [Bdellovibrionales bacterium]|nr:hypothetical protein [Bdellovibrionales bacterium]